MKTKPRAFYIWLVLSLLCGIGIFISSSIEGAVSGAASMAIAERIQTLIGIDRDFLHFLVRKFAHVMVFFLLAFCVTNTLKYVIKRKHLIFWVSWGISSAYGVLDEAHQYFVPGRVFAVTDMLLNAAGALLGTAFAYILYVKFYRKKY